jgi:Spy/CpxP family protein refolding chaperone
MKQTDYCLVVIWFACLSLALPLTGAAQDNTPSKPRSAAGTGPDSPAFGLPGYWLLSMETTQRELKLTADQKQQLRRLADKYQAEARKQWEQLRQLSPEEQQQKMKAWREKTAQQHAEVRRQVEGVLDATQRKGLQEIQWRTRGPATLGNPRTLEQLGLNDEQKQSLRQIREAWQQKTQQLQQEMFHKSLEVLTPEQHAKLKKHVDAPGW